MSVWFEYVVKANRVLTFLSYTIGLPLVCLNFSAPTAVNARFFWQVLLVLWLVSTGMFYYYMWTTSWSWLGRFVVHFLWLWVMDVACFWFVAAGWLVERTVGRTHCTNRLFNSSKPPEFRGKKIVILGNGPSLVKGEQLGSLIDEMDEVIRFNNFQTKTCGMESWTGTKTTVHFSDSMLYPSYPEYKVPGACLVLSLFMDRLMVSGSYFLFRMAVDLAVSDTIAFMRNPELGWISHEEIDALKATLQISKWKHPTSGCLAIDWFSRHQPDPKVPIYIHGFDFFQGDQIHYYSKTEPFYERLNDLVGVTMMHEPQKERGFVDKLVKEGKVKWLKDLHEERKRGGGSGHH